jgi:hypothetical protein
MSREPRTRRRAGLARAALVAVVGLVALLAAPGTASATYGGGGDGSVSPFVDCLRQNPDGTYTAVLGYTNSSRSAEAIARGSWNQVSPSRYDGRQPTTFASGTRHGALSLTLTRSEYMGGPYWYLDGNVVFFGWAWRDGVGTCPPSTELPEEGNGTGPAIVLLGAGVVGAVALHRVRRRALDTTVSTEEDRDDA